MLIKTIGISSILKQIQKEYSMKLSDYLGLSQLALG